MNLRETPNFSDREYTDSLSHWARSRVVGIAISISLALVHVRPVLRARKIGAGIFAELCFSVGSTINLPSGTAHSTRVSTIEEDDV